MILRLKTLPFLAPAIAASFLFLPTGPAEAGSYGSASGGSLESQANRELVRRQENLLLAQELIKNGDRAASNKDYAAAYDNYLDALDLIGSGSATADERREALDKFSRNAITYAEELINNGRYSDAERVAKTVLLPQYNPTYRPAVQLLSQLEQPDYYNKTVTPQFAADRDEVNKLLVEAEGFYSRGSFDLAQKRYEQVLNIDRYNIAARRGMERVDNARSEYYDSAYNETRSRMLWMVSRGWELPVRKFETGRSTFDATGRTTGTRTEQITAKLNNIIIPRLDLNDATIREAADFLRQLSNQLDTMEPDPARRGVNIFLKLDSGMGAGAATGEEGAPVASVPTEDTRITLALNNVPLYEALRYLSQLAGLRIKIEPAAVSLVPLTEAGDELVTKEYRVPPTFIPTAPAPGQEPTGGFGFAATPSDAPRISGRITAQQFLESQGVEFPPGASANYIPAGSKLIVRNTQDNIDLIDVLVDAAQGDAPTQIEIESKFVEINQNNLNELGFDWALGPLQLGSSGVYLGGGDVSGGNPANFPFTDPQGNIIGSNLVTSGLRSGTGTSQSNAIGLNGIDALLGGIQSGVAPGIFGLSGIFTNPQFQFVIRALDQKKGIDIMSAPRVTTKSGSKAIINIIREFRYPTQFDPPQIPQSTGGGSTSTIAGTSAPGLDLVAPTQSGLQTPNGIITPTTPTAFDVRNTGVTLDVTPVVGPDGYTIDLELSPEVVDFEGFIDYGTPILGVRGFQTLGIPQVGTFEITPNVINQPIFSTRKVTTNVTVWDGMTVALGGLIREDVQKVEDKVPILGDIPIAGRLFRSNVDQTLKKNLIIFVTARMIDAEGQPVRSELEEEEIVEPLGLPEELMQPNLPASSKGFFGK